MTHSQTPTGFTRLHTTIGRAFAAVLLAGALGSAPAMAAHDHGGGGHPGGFGGHGGGHFGGHFGGGHVSGGHFGGFGHNFAGFGGHHFAAGHPFGIARGWHGHFARGHYFGSHFGFVAGRFGTRIAIGTGRWPHRYGYWPGYRYGYRRPGYRFAFGYGYAPYGSGWGYPYWHHHYAPRYACRVIGWR